MKNFSFSFMVCLLFANAANAAYLPVVDVTRGNVSARAAFGEEIAQTKPVVAQPIQKTNTKKVVARTAKKQNVIATNSDVLSPRRPSSDLWARSAEAPLRMPRMDEINVVRSDILLPEESLDQKPVFIAQNDAPLVRDETLNEIKQLRSQIAELKQANEKIATRAATVRTPIASVPDEKPVAKNNNVNVQREVVEPNKSVSVRASVAEPKFTSVNDMSKMSPNELKKAFKKTYLSSNKHLSTYTVDNRFDMASDMSESIEGFSSERDLSETDSGVRPLEIKITFMNGDAGLSRENYNLLSESASIVVNNPKRAVQIAIPESATHSKDGRKLAAKRLAIVEQVLRDTGVAEQRIVPVLSQRDGDEFVLRIISGDTFESLTQQKRNMFGDTVSKKTYKSMSW